MIFKKFRYRVIVELIFIAANIAFNCWLLISKNISILNFILIPFLFYQVYRLINYIEKTNRDFILFLESIRYSDVSQSYSSRGKGKIFDELYEMFTAVNEEFRKARAKTEENYRYLSNVFQHVDIGLISYFEEGQIDLINSATKKILGIRRLTHIDGLDEVNESLPDLIKELDSGERKIITIDSKFETLQLMVSASKFTLNDRIYTLVSMQNIKSELETKEIESWQKLIRILTHEIMNSITPIASLTSTINDMIRIILSNEIDEENQKAEILDDLNTALDSIKRRSEGLLRFVTNYRNLTLIPSPKIDKVKVEKLFSRVKSLLRKNLITKNIELKIDIEPKNLELFVDPDQIEQVLINLIYNSINALENKKDKTITLSAGLDNYGKIVIEIKDNGKGIPEENREKIFLPFFSTSEGGSGIGLSLSKQIINMHGGSISFQSSPNEGTIFRVKL
ncbi:MAG: GHKL domain-containing protein [Acidobacteria bacterium]|nr:GHKL domain-containing protein [Acidobacteriota bacterium]